MEQIHVKYIRTNKTIYETNSYLFVTNGIKYIGVKNKELISICENQIVASANTVEELVQPGDLITIKDYWEHSSKSTHITVYDKSMGVPTRGVVTELHIRQENGDWKLVAKQNEEGELVCIY